METKFLRLRTPVELGSRFDDWSVCWLGGWGKHGMSYLVMLVRLAPRLFHCAPPVRAALRLVAGEAVTKTDKNKKTPPSHLKAALFVAND